MGKLRRIISSFFRQPVAFDTKLSTKPISSKFGMDRGVPIDRYYIEDFLNKYRSLITGNVLEIAESTYSKKFGEKVDKYEILHYDNSNKNATIVGDLTNIESLPENKVNCFICTQTLNFIYNPQDAIKGAYKLIKPGGVFLCTVSGISQISRYDMDRWGDYWRFTDLSIRKLTEAVFGKDNVEITIYGNVLAATAFLQGLSVDDLPDSTLLNDVDADYQVTLGIRAIKR